MQFLDATLFIARGLGRLLNERKLILGVQVLHQMLRRLGVLAPKQHDRAGDAHCPLDVTAGSGRHFVVSGDDREGEAFAAGNVDGAVDRRSTAGVMRGLLSASCSSSDTMNGTVRPSGAVAW